MITREQIEDVLSKIQDPHLQQDLVTAKMVRDIKIDGDQVQLQLEMGYPAKGYHEKMIDIKKSQGLMLTGSILLGIGALKKYQSSRKGSSNELEAKSVKTKSYQRQW